MAQWRRTLMVRGNGCTATMPDGEPEAILGTDFESPWQGCPECGSLDLIIEIADVVTKECKACAHRWKPGDDG